jgi:hypothetical protein
VGLPSGDDTLKPDRDYRFADAWIGVFLGAFVGGVFGVALAFGEFGDVRISPLFLVVASTGTGAVICGAMAFLLGKRFTDWVETVIAAVRDYINNAPLSGS